MLISIIYYSIYFELIFALSCKILSTILKQRAAQDLKQMGEAEVAYVLITYDKSDSWLHAFTPFENIVNTVMSILLILSDKRYAGFLEKTVKMIKPNIRKLKKK